MPSIDVIIETTPVYITVTPQTNPNIQVKFGAVDSVNGETGVVLINAVPNGGTTGQVLAKNSNTDNDTGWINVSAGGVQTLTGTTNRISIDNTDPANPIANIAASYDTAVTNAIAAAVSGKENTSNKQTDLTPSATKYPTVNAVNAGLANLIVGSQILGFPTFSPADSTTYYFGAFFVGVAPANSLNAFNKAIAVASGVVTSCALMWHMANIMGSNELVEIYLHNETQATSVQILNQATSNPRQIIASGLNLAVTAGDSIYMRMVTPAWSNNPVGLQFYIYLNITK